MKILKAIWLFCILNEELTVCSILLIAIFAAFFITVGNPL